MLRFAKTVGGLALVALGLQSASGFSLMGPANQAWQAPVIGYNLGGDIGTPHNLGEEYRWNTPTNYYAFDQNFLDYFGSNGVWTIEQGIAELNGLANFSQYSSDLTEVPLETRRINYRAQALHLMDLKSAAMGLMLEELGLTDSERYIWTLRTRAVQPGLACPFMIYGVIKLSFDPVNWQPSSYINGGLYSYRIVEICSGPNPLAVTIPFPVDPVKPENLPLSRFQTLNYGIFTKGLTRDDVGGLRYSYRTNNVNFEATSSDSTLFYTNIAAGQQLLFTSNLTTFSMQALTNNAGALQALYPNLGIVSSTNVFTNIYITNITAYFTNYPLDPVGTPQHLAFATNLTLTVQTWFHHTFNNLVTFTNPSDDVWVPVPLPDIVFHTNLSLLSVQTTTVTNQPFAPSGTPPITNTTTSTYLTNQVVGEFFILPTNLCDIAIASRQATLVTFETNIVVSATNTPTGFTNAQSFTQAIIDNFTNHVFTFYTVDCVVTNVALRQGIDKLTFLRANYDSLVGRFFQPITNVYYQIEVTNNLPIKRWLRRVVTTPDFLFTAFDTTDTAGLGLRTDTTGGAFNDANANTLQAGPGNIEPTKIFTFNKVGPLLVNVYNPNYIFNGLTESTATTNFIWGTFDGSTNEPVVYPSGTSIASLEAQILFQIVTGILPDGKVGTAYPATQVQATGGVLPYSQWTWGSGWPSLPPGLTITTNPDGSGLISGTPTAAGTFGFAVSVTGGDSRTITRSLSININP